MKRIDKPTDSTILNENIRYRDRRDNSRLSELLHKEQLGFCAYTETFLGRSDKAEIDHFNPKLKGTTADNYSNWFLTKARWNSEKSNKWDKFQPVLYPTAGDFNERIVYDNGYYRSASANDVAAQNIIRLLKLDDPDLADERKRYIARKKDEIDNYGLSPDEFFKLLAEKDLNSIRFLRAIEEEFNISIYVIVKSYTLI